MAALYDIFTEGQATNYSLFTYNFSTEVCSMSALKCRIKQI